FKKSILVILATVSCNNIHGVLDGQVSLLGVNRQDKKDHTSQSYVSYTLINITLLTILYGFATYTVKDQDLCQKAVVLNNLVVLAGITTTGSVIADGMKHLKE